MSCKSQLGSVVARERVQVRGIPGMAVGELQPRLVAVPHVEVLVPCTLPAAPPMATYLIAPMYYIYYKQYTVYNILYYIYIYYCIFRLIST